MQAETSPLWRSKRKGFDRIYTHPGIDRAIVKTDYGMRAGRITWDGQEYPTVEDAKAAAIASITREASNG